MTETWRFGEIAEEFVPLIDRAFVLADQEEFDTWQLRLFWALSDEIGMTVNRVRFDPMNLVEAFSVIVDGAEVWLNVEGNIIAAPPPLDPSRFN